MSHANEANLHEEITRPLGQGVCCVSEIRCVLTRATPTGAAGNVMSLSRMSSMGWRQLQKQAHNKDSKSNTHFSFFIFADASQCSAATLSFEKILRQLQDGLATHVFRFSPFNVQLDRYRDRSSRFRARMSRSARDGAVPQQQRGAFY